MTRLLLLARLALLAFPRRFRREHGRSLVQTFVADVRLPDGSPSWRRGLAAACDLVRAGFGERARFAGRLRADAWHAWRSLSANPGTTAATVLVLSLGIGLLAAMFALTDPFILRPLPYARADELVAIELGQNKRGARVPTVDEWRAQTHLFQGVAVYAGDYGPPVSIDGRWRRLDTYKVSGDFFAVIGIPGPAAPDWRAASSAFEAPALWSSRARRQRAKTIRAGDALSRKEDRALRVIGVLSPRFTFPSTSGQPDAVTFFAEPDLASATYYERGMSARPPATVIARLQPGVTPDVVRQALPNADTFGRLTVTPLSDWLTRDLQPLAWGAFAAGALVLLVCAGNVANIFVARGTYRLREFATRGALGASHRDLLRLWMVELLLVTGCAVLLGLLLTWISLNVVSTLIPDAYVVLGQPAMTARVGAFAALIALFVFLTGITPAAIVTKLASHGVFDRSSLTESRRIRTMRVVFAAGQTALAVVLAIGAAMLGQSYVNLIGRDKGYDESALYVNVDGISATRPAGVREIASSIEALQRIPGVTAVAATTGRIVGETRFSRGVRIDGVMVDVDVQPVSDGFFDVSGLGILQGRPLQPGDEHWKSVVVNQSFAKEHWPDESPVGRQMTNGPRVFTIVGVTRDALDRGLPADATPSIYVAIDGSGFSSGARFLIRVARGTDVPADRIRAAILGVSPTVHVDDIDTVGARLMQTIRDRTFATAVLTFFGIAGGLVTVTGLVGIVSFVVARRTKEIAIRTAIGARPSDIRRLVVREAVGAAIAGGLAGLVLGRWLSTWLESLVFGVDAGSWMTAVAAVTASLVILIAASLIPARRAVRLQPNQALRVD
jgi:predicted permease